MGPNSVKNVALARRSVLISQAYRIYDLECGCFCRFDVFSLNFAVTHLPFKFFGLVAVHLEAVFRASDRVMFLYSGVDMLTGIEFVW